MHRHRRIILLATEEEIKLIEKYEFCYLSNRLKGILLALIQSDKIEFFAIDSIINNYKPTLKDTYNKNIISNLIDDIDIFLRKYSVQDPFDKFDINLFKKKYLGKYYNNKSTKFDFIISSTFLNEPKKAIQKYNIPNYFEIYYSDTSKVISNYISYWEVLFRMSSGITILIEKNDGGKVYLSKARIATFYNIKFNSLNLIYRTSPILKVAFNKFYNNFESINKSKLFDLEVINSRVKNRRLNNFKFINLSIRNLINSLSYQPERFIRKFLSYFFNPYHRWNICIANRNLKNRSLEDWLHASTKNNLFFKNNWVADPFIFKVENDKYIIYEKYVYSESKGSIFSRKIIDEEGKLEFGKEFKILSNQNHLSYPYTFKRNNLNFFIPENSKNGGNLYLINKKVINGIATFSAEKIRKLFDGYAIDPSLVRQDDLDYLFVSGLNNKFSDVLYVFISSDIISQPIKMHCCSPLLVDHSLGRSAGRIFWDDNLKKFIRPSQICDKRYGEGITFSTLDLNEKKIIIKQLDYKLVPKSNSPYFSRFHHVDLKDDLITLDYAIKRHEFFY